MADGGEGGDVVIWKEDTRAAGWNLTASSESNYFGAVAWVEFICIYQKSSCADEGVSMELFCTLE